MSLLGSTGTALTGATLGVDRRPAVRGHRDGGDAKGQSRCGSRVDSLRRRQCGAEALHLIPEECASSSSGAEVTEGRKRRCNRATSSWQPAGGSPARGDARVPGSAAPGVGRDPGVEAGRGATGQSAASSEACGVVRNPRASGPRGSRACIPVAKAMDGTWEPGAGAQEPSGVGGVEWPEGCRGNWRGPRWPRAAGPGSEHADNRPPPGSGGRPPGSRRGS